MSMDVEATAWPSTVRKLPSWPAQGVTYSYEHRGYVRPEKLEHWLMSAFGAERAKWALYNGRLYIKAPRKPTHEEREWMEDSNVDSGVEVEECGWLTLANKENRGGRGGDAKKQKDL